MTIGIGAITCLLPPRRVAVTELPEVSELGSMEREFLETSGVRTVGIFEDGDVGSLAGRACKTLLEEYGGNPDVMIMVGPRAPDVLIGSDVCKAQAHGEVKSAFAFAVDGLGCAGSSAAWALARDLLIADPSRESVLITFASLPTGDFRIRYPVTVIGDGAYAMTVVRGGRPVLRAHRQETDGAFHDLFYVDYKSGPMPEWREECRSRDRYSFELAMHSRVRLSALVDGVLKDAGITKAEVSATLMQNVTESAFQFYEQTLELPIHQFCRAHLADAGHLGAMDVVLNLQRVVSMGGLSRGDFVLVLNNSPVAAWIVTLWEI
ncbi:MULTISPECIES: 3-oxoacyl-ACP synthase [unclassified Streptomyces]|uniref:3-oxoacyl-ACP synthase n=1 Tax=unclassified Streptomyces TaxID=2593676 RepID=UPI00224CA812|nr:3-oxoacyl-ACP synthase [Streptomyces sp. NBC_00347]MCX5123638.1 3-oxoacyl-ACP synthase [Streptomyces sp. NBC_00347]